MNAEPKIRRRLHPVKILRIQLEFLYGNDGVTKLAERYGLNHSTVSRHTTGKGLIGGAGDRQLDDLVMLSQRDCKFFAEMTRSEFGAFCVALMPPDDRATILSKILNPRPAVHKPSLVPQTAI
jgi:hypothetical protein